MSTQRSPAGRACRRSEPMPVRNNADALHLLHLAVAQPLEHETIGWLLDRRGRGQGNLITVSGTADPQAVLRVTELLAALSEQVPPFTRIVVATVRPQGGLLPDDIDRWLEASQVAEGCGAELIEWYVIHAGGISRPRELLGEPPRW